MDSSYDFEFVQTGEWTRPTTGRRVQGEARRGDSAAGMLECWLMGEDAVQPWGVANTVDAGPDSVPLASFRANDYRLDRRYRVFVAEATQRRKAAH